MVKIESDLDNKEQVLEHRQKRIEKKLLDSYAQEIFSNTSRLVAEHCYGCLIGYSRQHRCLMVEANEQLYLYFDDALKSISEAEVMKTFIHSMSDMNKFEFAKYISNDWRSAFCAEQRQALTLKLLYL